MLARRKRHGDIAVRRLDAAHDLRHREDFGIVCDLLHGGDLEGLVHLARPDQNGAGLKARGMLQHVIYADTDGAETQYSNFHHIFPLCLSAK